MVLTFMLVGNWCTFPSYGRYKVSLFGHGAFEGPSTSTDIKSGTPTRVLTFSPSIRCLLLQQRLWLSCGRTSTCMAGVAARGAQNIHSQVMHKLAKLQHIEAIRRCSRSTTTFKAVRLQWVVGGAEQGGSTTIKKSKAGRGECWQKGRHLISSVARK
ncbi:hypothetical protein GW17_00003499, partial [Ensete ventricosum]